LIITKETAGVKTCRCMNAAPYCYSYPFGIVGSVLSFGGG